MNLKTTDLKKMTQIELRDLRREIEDELNNYANRDRIKVCRLFKEFDETKFFIRKENALRFLTTHWLNDMEELFEDKCKITLEVSYLSAADAEMYCLDFNDKNLNQ